MTQVKFYKCLIRSIGEIYFVGMTDFRPTLKDLLQLVKLSTEPKDPAYRRFSRRFILKLITLHESDKVFVDEYTLNARSPLTYEWVEAFLHVYSVVGFTRKEEL